MTPIYARPIVSASGDALSRPVWFSDYPRGQYAVFHDTAALYLFTETGTPAFRFAAKTKMGISGFAVGDGCLYVQDGDVLYQYVGEAMHRNDVVPSNAISFRPAEPQAWSAVSGGGDGFSGLLELPFPDGGTPRTFSAPLLGGDNDGRVHVLASDGTVYSPTVALERNPTINRTPFVPDQTVLYWDPGNGRPRLCWVSGGEVAVLDTGELEVHELDAWRWRCRSMSVVQPWRSFGAAATAGFISSFVAADTSVAAVTLREFEAGPWSFHVLDPPCQPMFNDAGRMPVTDAGSAGNDSIIHHCEALPPGFVVTLPPAQHEWSGIFKNSGGGTVDILCAPYLREEPEGRFAYVIAADGGTPLFCKYRVPPPSDSYFLCWWKAVRDSYATIQPILAKQIIYSLTNEVEAAVGSKLLPADFAQTNMYWSPLWSLTACGTVPWDALAMAPPVYMRLSTYAVYATPIDNLIEAGGERRTWRFAGETTVIPPLPDCPWRFLQQTNQLQVNVADGIAVDVCGRPTFGLEGSEWFLYVNLAKGEQYFAAKFQIPHVAHLDILI
jgi:hypothetical protein